MIEITMKNTDSPCVENPASDKRSLAIICHTLPPYRQHLHKRVSQEISALKLLTINTHADQSREWSIENPATLGIVDLSKGHAVAGRKSLLNSFSMRRLGRDWSNGYACLELLRKERAACVIVNGYNDLGRLRVLHWCQRNSVPAFLWADSNVASERDLPLWKSWIKQQLIAWVDKRVHGFFACGSLGKQYWEHYGVDSKKIFTSPYEPDYHLISSLSEETVARVAAKHGLEPDRRRLLFSGRLIREKRPDLLIRAFLRIAQERPNWDLVFLGDGPLKPELLTLAAGRYEQRIKWLSFSSDQSEVSALNCACDALVLPSDYEPWALVVNEAVAAGLAVVATTVVAAAVELVRDGENGRLVEPGQLASLEKALLEVTDLSKIDAMKASSAKQLLRWREEGDPVEGIRRALSAAGVL